jgi:hypothetical protein
MGPDLQGVLGHDGDEKWRVSVGIWVGQVEVEGNFIILTTTESHHALN